MYNEQVKRDNRKARCIFLLGKGSEGMPSAFPTSDRQCRELMKASAALKTPEAVSGGLKMPRLWRFKNAAY